MPVAAATTRKTKKKKKKIGSSSGGAGGGGGITIKPFVNPPSLPPDFYETTSDVLIRCTFAILRRETLYVPIPESDDDGGGGKALETTGGAAVGAPPASPKSIIGPPSSSKAGAEDDDGCGVHDITDDVIMTKPSPPVPQRRRRPIGREELYRSVEDLVVHGHGPRLYSELLGAMDDAAGECLDRVLPNSAARATAAGGGGGAAPPSSDRTGFVTDGRGVHRPPAGAVGEDVPPDRILTALRTTYESYVEYLTFVRSIFLHLDRAFVYVPDDSVGGGGGGGHPRSGRAVRRSGGGVGGVGVGPPSSSSATTWSLWDAGVALLRNRMNYLPSPSSSSSSSPSSGGPSVSPSSVPPPPPSAGCRSVSSTLVTSIVSSLLSELDNVTLDRTLVRSSVRMVSDLDLYGGPFLAELATDMTIYFEDECRRWMDGSANGGGGGGGASGGGNGNGNGGGNGGGGGDAPTLLRHMENRLRKVSDMSAYYLLTDSATPLHLPRGAGGGRHGVRGGGGGGGGRGAGGGSSPGGGGGGVLTTIVETNLLSPNLTPAQILHPRNLYPLLDDPERIKTDIRRLYDLCGRVPGGIDALRVGLGEYGRDRGLAVVRGGGGGRAGGEKPQPKEAERTVIPRLLDLKRHVEELHALSFRGDESFAATIRGVWEDVLNAGGGGGGGDEEGDGGRRVAELLAKHVDLRFRNAKIASAAVLGGGHHQHHHHHHRGASAAAKGDGGEDASAKFQQAVMALFRHVHSKDVFEAFYKRDLAKRLLLHKITSVDMEKAFLTLLKTECGGGYTGKMEGMFKDVELSRGVMRSYESYCAGQTAAAAQGGATDGQGPNAVDMDVQVLTTGYWPVYPPLSSLVLPPQLSRHQDRFENYYKSKYQGRRIAWQYSLGNCIVRAHFPRMNGRFTELNVSLCQALVLLCFNVDDADSNRRGREARTGEGRGLTILDVMKKTGIDDRTEAERVLQSLSLGKDGTRVLVKVDHVPDAEGAAVDDDGGDPDAAVAPKKKKPKKPRRNISDGDAFHFNANFHNPARRVKITNIQLRDTAADRTKTVTEVNRDRLYLVDAAVVRIMKARKTIGHRSLMAEVMAQLRFPASASDVKRRVESLIEREYMERDGKDRSRYNYLA